MKYYIGIDLGGTNIVAAVVDENYQILTKASTKTNRPRPAQEIADDMAAMALKAVSDAGLTLEQIEWVGVGTPGLANSQTGIVEFSNNLGFVNTLSLTISKSISTSPYLSKTMPMPPLTANMSQALPKARKMLSALPSVRVSAEASSSTARFMQVLTSAARKSVILSFRWTALPAPAEEKAVLKPIPLQPA